MARGIKSWIWLGLKGLFVLILIGLGLVWAVLKTLSLEVRSPVTVSKRRLGMRTLFENPTTWSITTCGSIFKILWAVRTVSPGPFPTQSMHGGNAQGLEAYCQHATVFVELEGVRILQTPC